MSRQDGNRLDWVIADNAKKILEKQGRSPVALAEASGLSKPYIYSILRGERRVNTDLLLSLSDGLGVHPRDLLVYDEDNIGDRFGGVEISGDEGDLLRAYRMNDAEAIMRIAFNVVRREERASKYEVSRDALDDDERKLLRIVNNRGPAAAARHLLSLIDEPQREIPSRPDFNLQAWTARAHFYKSEGGSRDAEEWGVCELLLSPDLLLVKQAPPKSSHRFDSSEFFSAIRHYADVEITLQDSSKLMLNFDSRADAKLFALKVNQLLTD